MDANSSHSNSPQETNARALQRCQERVKNLTVCLEVARLINSTLELNEVLNRIMTTSKAIMQADACSLMLVDEATDELVFQVAHGSVGDQLKQGFRLARGQGIAGHVFDTGAPLLIADAYQDPRFHRDFDLRTGYRTRSILCVPIKIKDRVIGVSQVINKLDGSAFTRTISEMLTLLSMHAAVAIENARMHQALLRKQQMESDLAFATGVQQSFLPQSVPELPGFPVSGLLSVGARSRRRLLRFYPPPRRAAGRAHRGCVRQGRGVGALYGAAHVGVSPACHSAGGSGPCWGSINELLCERSQRGMFVTLLYLVLDGAGRTITYVNAGHLPPLLWNQGSGRLETVRQGGGPPLGIVPGRRYAPGSICLQPGDSLVLTTDGLVEARDREGQQWGWAHLEKTLRAGPSRADAICHRLLEAVKHFVSGAPQADDMTMVVMGVEGDEQAVAAAWQPGDPGNPQRSGRFVPGARPW